MLRRIAIVIAALAASGFMSYSAWALDGPALGSDIPSANEGSKIAGSQAAIGAFDLKALKATTTLQPDRVGTRGLNDVRLFARLSPSVVMVVTDSGLGSGSIVDSKGSVLTNWHVVAGAKEIGVVFKPPADGAEPSRADFRSAKVIRLDEVTDLALLSVVNPPANRLPITLGSIAGLSVGTDVNAIGHPTGEAWTYTKGIVSQIRRSYEWKTESGVDHRAEVIQTQTPINPGSSGGPLFTDQGALVGVNSFVAQGEGLNFAVSVTEVRRFLAAKSNRIAKQSSGSGLKAADRKCDGQLLGETRLNDQAATGTVIDGDCDGRPDAILVAPDDPREPIELRIDSNADGKIDIIILDFERDDKWDESYADTNGDGKPDSHGFHDDGSLHPTRVESVNSG